MARQHPISQREARRLKKRVEALEKQRADERSSWGRRYPGWHVWTLAIDVESRRYGRLEAAQTLGRVLIAKLDDGKLEIHAVS